MSRACIDSHTARSPTRGHYGEQAIRLLGNHRTWLAVGLGLASIEPVKGEKRLAAPLFQVYPFWPKPLPTMGDGESGGTCIDSQDHLFIGDPRLQTGGLVSPEGGGRPEKIQSSPPVIELGPAPTCQ